jgi:tripartite-type tricarboxylate transporter receptor subunit TctC
MLKPRLVAAMISIGLMVLGAGVVCGQNYPNKPIRILSAEVGGGADFVARIVAQHISGPLGRQVVVENRPSRLIGEIALKATPDGYTLLLASSTFLFAPLFGETPYDPVKDFLPISMLAKAPNVIVVHPSVPVTSVKELIALAKARPGALNYGSGGTGSSLHLAAELFKQMAGVDIARIAYKGAGPAMNDLIGGQVQMVFATAGSVTAHVKSGRLKALAVTSLQPSALTPGLPTVAASGVPGYEVEAIYALVAPAKTPAAIIKQLNQVIVLVLNEADLKEKFLNAGIEAAPNSPVELAAKIKSEIAKIARLIKDEGIRAN